MAESIALCPYCGHEMACEKEVKTQRCTKCKRTFIVKHGIHLYNFNENPKDVLVGARKALPHAVKANDYGDIYQNAKTLIELLPDDFEARYFYAYAQKHRHQPKYMQDFLTTSSQNLTDESIEIVVNHIFDRSDPHDYSEVKTFLELVKPQDLDAYEQIHTTRKAMEENYAMIPREAFLCFHPNDEVIANRIVKSLEEENHRCWIETRNLQPKVLENKWQYIKEAIASCTVFIVVSSKDAMLSKDVIETMKIASELDKPRLEFKIDATQHTQFFKEFFLALSPLEAVSDIRGAFEALKPRFFKKLLEIKKSALSKKTSAKPEDILVEQATHELKQGRFGIAEDLADKALELNLENTPAWIVKWLAKHEFIDLDDIRSFYDKEVDFFAAIDMFQSKEYTTAKQFDYTKALIPYTEYFESRLTKEIQALENTLDKNHLEQLLKLLPQNHELKWMHLLFDFHIFSNRILESMIADSKYINTLKNFFESTEYIKIKRTFPLDHPALSFEATFNETKTNLDESTLKILATAEEKTTALEHQIATALSREAYKKALKMTKKIPEKTAESIAKKSYYLFLATHQFQDEVHAHEYIKDPAHMSEDQKILSSKSYKALQEHHQYLPFVQSLQSDVKVAEDHYRDYKQKIKKKKQTKQLHSLVGMANLYAMAALAITLLLTSHGLSTKVDDLSSLYFGYPMLLLIGSAIIFPAVLMYRDKVFVTVYPDAKTTWLRIIMISTGLLWLILTLTVSVGYYFFLHDILLTHNYGYLLNSVGVGALILSYFMFVRSIKRKRRVHEFKTRLLIWSLVFAPLIYVVGFSLYTVIFR